jgi:hypothetical protein
MDMRYALAWRLHCDKVLTLTTGPGLQHFRSFLQRGTDGITSDTYLKTTIPGRFFPNFGFHFQPHNKIWPTLFDPLEHFKSPLIVSLEAQDYEPVTIEVHGDRWAPIPALLTRDERSTQRHRAATPRHSRVSPPRGPVSSPARPPTAPTQPQANHEHATTGGSPSRFPLPGPPQPRECTNPTAPGQHLPTPGFSKTFLPNTIQPFSPPPNRPPAFHQGRATTPFTHSARSLFPPALGPNVPDAATPSSTQRFDYMTALIYTKEHRAAANIEHLSICLLLTHYSPDFSLYDVVHCCQMHFPIFPSW